MKMLLLSFVALFGLMSFADGNLPATDNALPPYTAKVCWTVFGGYEVICMTVEVDGTLGIKDGLKISSEISSTGDYMNLIFPRNVKSGSITVAETLNFELCGNEITIQKGTKISVRNGTGRVSLK